MAGLVHIVKSEVTREINWENVRRVVIDTVPVNEKPSVKTLHQIYRLLPKCYIHGFGLYSSGIFTGEKSYYVLVESDQFRTPWGQPIMNVSMSSLYQQFGIPAPTA